MVPFSSSADTSTEHLTISVSPSELSQAGTVSVSITLRNTNSASKEITFSEPDDPDETEPPPTEEPIVTPAPTNPPQPSGSYTNISISNSYGVSFETSGVSVEPGGSRTFSSSMSVTSEMIGTSLSLSNCFVYLLSSLAGQAAGFLMDKVGGSAISIAVVAGKEVKHYPARSYLAVMIMLLLMVSFAIWNGSRVPETNGRNIYKG